MNYTSNARHPNKDIRKLFKKIKKQSVGNFSMQMKNKCVVKWQMHDNSGRVKDIMISCSRTPSRQGVVDAIKKDIAREYARQNVVSRVA